MKRRDVDRLPPQDKKAVQELIINQSNAVHGIRKEKNKGFSDLPLFGGSTQTELF